MWTEISLAGGLIMAGGRLAAELTGETKQRREESMQRAVDRHFENEKLEDKSK